MPKYTITSTSYTEGTITIDFTIANQTHTLSYKPTLNAGFDSDEYTLDGVKGKPFTDLLLNETAATELIFTILDEAMLKELRKRWPEADYMTDHLLFDTAVNLAGMSIDPLAPTTTWEEFRYHSEN